MNTTLSTTTKSTTSTTSPAIQQSTQHLDPAQALRVVDRRSYAVIASTSAAGNSHSAGVLYARSDNALYCSTMGSSRKARNIAANPSVGVTIPVRRVPVGGPPSAIMFQARAELIDPADPAFVDVVATGDLKAITEHGELELPGGVFVRITLPRRLHTYGLGMSLLSLIRDPLNAAGTVDLKPVLWP